MLIKFCIILYMYDYSDLDGVFFQANKVAVTTMPSTIRPSIVERRPSTVSNIVRLLHVHVHYYLVTCFPRLVRKMHPLYSRYHFVGALYCTMMRYSTGSSMYRTSL